MHYSTCNTVRPFNYFRKISEIVFRAFLILFLVLQQLVTPANAQAPTSLEESGELIEKVGKNVVFLEGKDEDGNSAFGFGFLVGREDGVYYLATARHLFYDKNNDSKKLFESVTVRLNPKWGRSLVQAYEVVPRDRAAELSKDLDVSFAWFTPTENMKNILIEPDVLTPDGNLTLPGDTVNTVGYLDEQYPVWRISPFLSQVKSNKKNRDLGGDRIITYASIDADIPKGTSGAPLVSLHGITGIFRGTGTYNEALGIESVQVLAREMGVPWQLSAYQYSDLPTGPTSRSNLTRIGLAVAAVIVGGLVAAEANKSSKGDPNSNACGDNCAITFNVSPPR